MRISLILIIAFSLNMALRSEPCDIPISMSFDSVAFNDFILSIEKENNVHFFMKPAWIDSIFITSRIVPTTLREILNENLKGTRLYFYIYDCSKVIITRDYVFVEDVPAIASKKGDITSSEKETKHKESSFVKREFRNNREQKNGIIKIGDPSNKNVSKFATVSGRIMDTINHIPINGAVVFFDNTRFAGITDRNGLYSVNTELGIHSMHIRRMGKIEKILKVVIYGNGIHNESLEDETVSLPEVYVYANKENNVRDIQLGVERMDANMIKQIPSSVGESDILKTALLLPGVQTVGEGASGFNVRGGSTDQNLMLIDNSPVYNSSHLFGFFSAINAEMVQDFELYKSSFPAYFGGRLSSIVDVNLRKGNPEKFSLRGGISPVTGKLMVEGPIVKGKAAFILSGRSTYSDWILKRVNSPIMRNSDASFYDLNAKLNIDPNSNNAIQLSGYYSHDYFKLNSDTCYSYENMFGNLMWKHTFSERFSMITTGIFSEYKYHISSLADPAYAFNLKYDIQHFEGKLDFQYLMGENHKMRLGINSIRYSLSPGILEPGPDALIRGKELSPEQGIESALYLNDEYRLGKRLLFNLGFRYSLFYALGPAKVYKYTPESPRNLQSRMDSSLYSRNAITAKYGNPEFRISSRIQITSGNSIKASYTRMFQYIHMLTNTMAVSPTDTWTLSDPNLKPESSWQVSLGYFQNLFHDICEASAELYYKESDNILDFKPGAQLLLNPDLELDLLAGKGRAYGIELMIRKKFGKLNGWVNYTYSRSLIKIDSKFMEEKINGGRYYPTNYDKPHDFNIVSNYKFSRRISASATITYSTGHPITYPVGWYSLRGRDLLHYSNRNEYRIPDYFRVDFSLNLEGNLKIKKLAHSSWSLSVYNLTGRNNIYSVYFVSDPYSYIKGYKLSVFSRAIPSITYNFKF